MTSAPAPERPGRASGFTLVELLVALAAFAVLSGAAGAALTLGMESRDQLRDRERLLGQFEVARAILKDDFAQLAARQTRTPDGGVTPPFRGGSLSAEGPLVAFVRRGWSNPDGAEARGSLQYVEYAVENGTLVRRSRARLDPAGRVDMRSQVLLTGVSGAGMSFYFRNQWTDLWLSGSRSTALPDAVALRMDVEGLGEVRQLFLAPGDGL